MKFARPWLAVGAWLAFSVAGAGVEAREKTTSRSRQFIVFCTDAAVRARVAGAAEDTKTAVLALLGERDRWKFPILICIEPASTASPVQPAKVGLFANEEGFKVQIDVSVGREPGDIFLQKHLVRALLLEFSYRGQPQLVQGGTAYREPPWWLAEGALQFIRNEQQPLDSGLFRRMLETNKLPAIEQFLAGRPDELGATANAVDQACARCVVQLLLEQKTGRANLARFLKHWPASDGNAATALAREYPALREAQSLQKWWTLGMARLSATDRYKGLSAEDTESELAGLLALELPVGKKGEKKTFALGEFEQFAKMPAAKPALFAMQGALVGLSARANALYRPIVADYEQIVAGLARGKAHGIKQKLARVEAYRETVSRRLGDIADYLNWFEATQIETRSKAFDGYFKAANEMSAGDAKRRDPIARHLDEVAAEY